MKVLALRRPDTCAGCGTDLPAGTKAAWDAEARTVRCLPCSTASDVSAPVRPHTAVGADDALQDVQQVEPRTPSPPIAPHPARPVTVSALQPRQVAGGSAQREYDKRSQRREAAIRSRHPRLGGLVLALTNEPASTRVWAQGAHGERAVAAKIDELAGEHLIALHDRRMLRPDGRPSRANIDHLVVTAAGVWIVDAKTHHGTLEVRRSGGLFSPRVERLYIGGRDKTTLLDGLAAQVEAVRAVLDSVSADVPVRGALCFVGTELPWFGSSIGGVPLVGRRGLGKLLTQPGDFAPDDRAALAAYLEGRFIPA
jgi:Nuclease-related domain